MPHLIIEYSSNLESRIDLDGLMDRLHAAALETGVFPIGGLRVRAHAAEHYRIADNHPDNGFVHVTALIGHGRPLDVRQQAGQHLFDVLTEHLEGLYRQAPLAVSFNVQEFHPDLNFKRNNLHEYVVARREAGHEIDDADVATEVGGKRTVTKKPRQA
ncbi:MAG: 5-carboxymethyl-2-hydroxymuconate Delta-isomerase [Gammaproteobacteria bacterium]|nr:5-carboxymethyl-2-hydroxymuconate Delta-isomerase [Gammaproteobacteria bacterium]